MVLCQLRLHRHCLSFYKQNIFIINSQPLLGISFLDDVGWPGVLELCGT